MNNTAQQGIACFSHGLRHLYLHSDSNGFIHFANGSGEWEWWLFGNGTGVQVYRCSLFLVVAKGGVLYLDRRFD